MWFSLAALALAVLTAAGDPVASLRLEAPYDELFQTSKNTEEYAVDGKLTDADGKTTAVKVSVRGHTSRRESECEFPKLKVLRPDGTSLKIGTHCGDATDGKLTAKYGRLPNEKSPWREAAVYHILHALDVPTLQAKAARISYVYPDGRSVERNALLIEDDDDAVKRIGGTADVDAKEFTTAADLFTPADAAMLAFGQALVGNFDWCVKFTADDTYRCDARNKLWNVIGARMPDGKVRPIMHDFDVSGIVTGSHAWFKSVFNGDFIPGASPRQIEVVAQLQRTRSLFPRGQLDETRKRFSGRKAEAYRALEQANVDPDGRTIMKEYLDAFFNEIESDEQFYRPVVVTKGTLPRSAAGATSPAVCPALGAIPVGTPVSAPLDTSGEFVKVVVLDALWHWATPKHCAPIKTGPIWIPSSVISREYPK